MLANATGALSYEVWSMTRPSASAMQFAQRRLAASTAIVGGIGDPTGTRVLLWRRVNQGREVLTQLSVMPADSGAETLVGPPRELAEYDWARDGRGIVVGVVADDTVVVSYQDVESGRSSLITTLPRSEFQAVRGFRMLEGGGMEQIVRMVDVGDVFHQNPGE